MLSGLTPFKIIVVLIVFVWLLGMALAAPEWIALMGVGDLAVYLDATVIVMLLGTGARLKHLLTPTIRLAQEVAGHLVARFKSSRARSHRTRRRRHGTAPSPDDAGSPAGWAFPACPSPVNMLYAPTCSLPVRAMRRLWFGRLVDCDTAPGR